MRARNVTTTRRRPPASVWIAVVALFVVIGFQGALAALFTRSGQVGWGMYAFAAVLWAVLLGGLLRGSRLAWQWTRYLGAVLGAVMTGAMILAALRHELSAGVVVAGLLGVALPLFAAALALSRPSAYAFFALVCPECGARTGLGADILFRQARCRSCHHEW